MHRDVEVTERRHDLVMSRSDDDAYTPYPFWLKGIGVCQSFLADFATEDFVANLGIKKDFFHFRISKQKPGNHIVKPMAKLRRNHDLLWKVPERKNPFSVERIEIE